MGTSRGAAERPHFPKWPLGVTAAAPWRRCTRAGRLHAPLTLLSPACSRKFRSSAPAHKDKRTGPAPRGDGPLAAEPRETPSRGPWGQTVRTWVLVPPRFPKSSGPSTPASACWVIEGRKAGERGSPGIRQKSGVMPCFYHVMGDLAQAMEIRQVNADGHAWSPVCGVQAAHGIPAYSSPSNSKVIGLISTTDTLRGSTRWH